MQYFDTYTSNTIAGSGNQTYFSTGDAQKVFTGRLFYRILQGGTYGYSFLFSNLLDSTFSDGSHSVRNQPIGQWQIRSLSVAVCPTMEEIGAFREVTFSGNVSKSVAAGERFFATDPILLDAPQDAYLCLQIAFCGEDIPHHEETILPTFLYENGDWVRSTHVPFPSMIGIDRAVERKVAFLGDSITQGIGTEHNAYVHWNALLAKRLDSRNAYWNLGLGFARASDAASRGIWLEKAMQATDVVLCLGVNDLLQGASAETVSTDLQTIVRTLRENRVRVLIQTLPPFDYTGELIGKWNRVNDFIRHTLASQCEGFFDVVPVLGKSAEEPHLARYGGHPDAIGCARWADALDPVMRAFLS